MESYSLDLRQRIVQSYLDGEGSIRAIAKRFLVSPTTVCQYLKLYRQKKNLLPKEYLVGRKPAVADKQLLLVKSMLQNKADMTLTELCTDFEKKTGIKVSSTSMHRAIEKINWTYKKRRYVLRSKIEKILQQSGKCFRNYRQRLTQEDLFLLLKQASI